MSRRATRREGQSVTTLYVSANRDEDVFGPTSEELAITTRMPATMVPGVKQMPVRLVAGAVSG